MGAQSKRTVAESGIRGTAYTSGAGAKIDTLIWGKVAKVATALQDERMSAYTEVPAASLGMLALGAKGALSAPIEDRHAIQEVVCGYLTEVFAEIGAGIEAKAQKDDAMTATMKADVERCAAALLTVGEAVTAAEKQVKDAELCCAAACDFAVEAEHVLTASEEAHKIIVEGRSGTEKELKRYEDIQNGTMKMMLDGDWTEEKEAKLAVDSLMEELKSIGAEAALLSSAPPVLMKKPADRKGFDSFVLDTLGKALSDKAAQASAELAVTQEAMDKAVLAVASRKEGVQKAKVDGEANKKGLQDAWRIQVECLAAKEEASKVKADAEAKLGAQVVDPIRREFTVIDDVLKELLSRSTSSSLVDDQEEPEPSNEGTPSSKRRKQ